MARGNKPKFTVAQVERAIVVSRGNILAAANNLKCSRETVYAKIRRHSRLQKVVDEQREEMLDFAEAKLYNQIRDDNLTAIIFFLKTQGRVRGYSQRFEVEGAEDGRPIAVSERRDVTIKLIGVPNGTNRKPGGATDSDGGTDAVPAEHEKASTGTD